MPEGDLLLIAGDTEGGNHPFDQIIWIDKYFSPWLEKVSKKIPKIIGIAGNHSWCCSPEYKSYLNFPDLSKYYYTYLEDSSTVYDNYKIYGNPWTNPFFQWAFMATEEEQKKKFKNIPLDIDIIVSHGPPYGFGDPSLDGTSVGSKALLAKLDELPNLKLVVCGHLHSGYGIYQHKNVKIVNAALLDEQYRMTKEPIVIELPDKESPF